MKPPVLLLSGCLATFSATAGEFLQKLAEQHPLSHAGAPAQVQNPATPKPWTHRERGPVPDLKEFARDKEGAVWLGSELGAARFRFDPAVRHPWDRWQ